MSSRRGDIVFIFAPSGLEETYRYKKLPHFPCVGEYVEFTILGIWKVERVHWQVDEERFLVYLGLNDR
jgi:hypothetical protein